MQHGCRRSLASLGMTGASLRWERRAEPVIPRPEGPRDRLTGWIILATNPRRSAGPTFAARVAHSCLWGRRSCGGGGGQEKRASGFAGASGGGCGGPSERSCGRSASGPPRGMWGRRSRAGEKRPAQERGSHIQKKRKCLARYACVRRTGQERTRSRLVKPPRPGAGGPQSRCRKIWPPPKRKAAPFPQSGGQRARPWPPKCKS